MATTTLLPLRSCTPSQRALSTPPTFINDPLAMSWSESLSHSTKENHITDSLLANTKAKDAASWSLENYQTPRKKIALTRSSQSRLKERMTNRSRHTITKMGEPAALTQTVEDWSNDYILGENAQSFVVAVKPTNVAVERPDKSSASSNILSPVPVRPGQPNDSLEQNPKRKNSGLSPLSRSTTEESVMDIEGDFQSSLWQKDDEVPLRPFPESIRRIKPHPLPRRSLGIKNRVARVAPRLDRDFHNNHILRRISALGIEAPELDHVDERSIEFVLDMQTALAQGYCAQVDLRQYGHVESKLSGTPYRKWKWRKERSFPWRMKPYGFRVAERRLASECRMAPLPMK